MWMGKLCSESDTSFSDLVQRRYSKLETEVVSYSILGKTVATTLSWPTCTHDCQSSHFPKNSFAGRIMLSDSQSYQKFQKSNRLEWVIQYEREHPFSFTLHLPQTFFGNILKIPDWKTFFQAGTKFFMTKQPDKFNRIWANEEFKMKWTGKIHFGIIVYIYLHYRDGTSILNRRPRVSDLMKLWRWFIYFLLFLDSWTVNIFMPKASLVYFPSSDALRSSKRKVCLHQMPPLLLK